MSKIEAFLANFNERELVGIYKDNELLYEGVIEEVINCLAKDYTIVPGSVTLNDKHMIIRVK